MKGKKEDEVMRKSFCLSNKMYRVRRKGFGTIVFMKNTDLTLFNRQNTASNQEQFEFYPYKPYWFYRLKYFSSKNVKIKQGINIFKKTINSWLVKGIILALVLYAIKIIFKIEL